MDVFKQELSFLPRPKFEYINKKSLALKALEDIKKYDVIEVDTEGTGLDPYESKTTLLQIGTGSNVYVFDTRFESDFSDIDLSIFKNVLTNPGIVKILHNANYDMKMIKVQGGYYLNNIYDTMIAEQLLFLGVKERGFALGNLVEKYLGLTMNKEPRGTFENYYQEYQQYQLEYAATDVTVLSLIRDLQWLAIEKHQFQDVCRLEFEFIKPMCEMELNGITMDVVKWRKMMAGIEDDKNKLNKEIGDLLIETEDQMTLFGDCTINIDSNAQLRKALNKFGLNLINTSEETLRSFAGIKVIDLILEYRKYNKLISTYGEPLLAKISGVTGRLHTAFKQMVRTGRMSSSNPNLQNIPGKQKFRSCFVAKPGYVLITADMSGAELRILGNVSEDPIFIDSYKNGLDLHTRTASEVFGIAYDEVLSSQRKAAKAVNFGLCLTEDSNVFTSDGIVYIKDINLGSDVAHDIGNNEVIDKKFMGEKEVFEITTKYGYSIEATEDHLFKVIDTNGEYVDKKLKDLDLEKDYICLKKGSNIFNKNIFDFEPFNVEQRTNYKDFITPKSLTLDWAAFLGLFVSEGSVLKVKNREKYSCVSFGFSKDDSEFIDKIENLFSNIFGDRFSKTESKYNKYSINSVCFGEWLVNVLALDDNKTNSVRIPECIKKSPKEYQIEFLRYLFEGDGTIKKNGLGYKICYSSNSINLIKDLQTMLLNLDVLSSITEEFRGGVGGYYVLSVLSCSNDVFIDNIGFLTGYKNNKANGVLKYKTSNYFLGSHKDKLGDILANFNVSKQIRDRFYKSRHSDNIGDIYLNELSKYDCFFNFIKTNGIVPLSIKDIKTKGVKKVYDISVDKHQYFLANGFVVHNCYGLSKYGLSKRIEVSVKEAEEMISTYFKRYKGVKKYLDTAAMNSITYGFTRTISGRKRFYNLPANTNPDRDNILAGIKRAGMNAGIQGANADTIKQAMIYCVERLENSPYDARLVLTVHDEVIIECLEEHKYEVLKIVEQSLIDGFGKYFHLIPMETDGLIGPCWLKGKCETKVDGTECGGKEMVFIPDTELGTKLICKKCGSNI